MKLKSTLNDIVQKAFSTIGIDANPIPVSDATKEEFGDYQFNGAMALAKKLGKSPREIALDISNILKKEPMLAKVEVAGPGFINLWIDSEWLAENLQSLYKGNLSVEKVSTPQKIVVDYSSPNMAKQMHVGHLRSTIIGDTLARLSGFLGNDVIRQNHIGDWGTQFGMLIAYLESTGEDAYSSLGDLEQFYKNAKIKFDEDKDFANIAREYVVKLQSGDQHCLDLWKQFINVSLGHCEDIYEKLGISLSRDHVKAESSYNDDLSGVAKELKDKGLAVQSNGALCIFMEDSDIPLIIQKSDGGFLYATTDLAAIKYRVDNLGAKKILYVVDARQAGHFRQIFDIARRAGYIGDDISVEHISFGMMLDKSGRPFKTRDGGTVKLSDLLEEAISRAKTMIEQRDTQVSDIDKVAQILGIGAVKYAELSINRESNYIFDWDRMLTFDGNTSLYLQYAYARIQSILRRVDTFDNTKFVFIDELERRLSVELLKFEDILNNASRESMPHYITTYLYDLTTLYMKFYENNPILKEGVSLEQRDSRLALSELTAKTIKQGLEILGIEVLDRI